MRELTDKVAVVTGAGSGIGLAIATALAAEGMRVALADVDEGRLDVARAELINRGTPADALLTQVTDVRDADAVGALADRVFADWSQVDVLVNNAGVVAGGFMWERSAEDFEFVLGVNLWGILHGIRAFVPRMLAQGTEGHIVNTCSIAGLLATPLTGPYNVSKFAALAASEALAMDLDLVGAALKVTAVCPGMVQTGLADTSEDTRPNALASSVSEDEQFLKDQLVEMIAGGIAPEDVASQVVDAIRTERFLVLTHDHHPSDIVAAAERRAAGALPNAGDYA